MSPLNLMTPLCTVVVFSSFLHGSLAQPSAQPGSTQVLSREQVTNLIDQIQAQQALIQENQQQIDERLTKITELLRQARLFSARRSGGGGSPATPTPTPGL